MQTMPLEQAEGHLAEILERLTPGDEVVLTDKGQPLALNQARFPGPRGEKS